MDEELDKTDPNINPAQAQATITSPATIENNNIARASTVAHANPYDQVSQFFKTSEPVLDQAQMDRDRNVARVNSFGTALSSLIDAVGGAHGATIPKREVPETSTRALNDYNQEKLRYAYRKDAYDKEQLGLKLRGLQWQDEQNRASMSDSKQLEREHEAAKQHEKDQLFRSKESQLDREARAKQNEADINNSRTLAGMHIAAAREANAAKDSGITPENHPNDFRSVTNAVTGELKYIPKNSFNTVLAQLVSDNGGVFDKDTAFKLDRMGSDPVGQQGLKEQWVQQNWYKYPKTRDLVYKLSGDTQSDPRYKVGSEQQYRNLLLKPNKTKLENDALIEYNLPKVHDNVKASQAISNTINNKALNNETKKREIFKLIQATGADKVEAKRQLDILIQSYKL